MIFTFGSNHSCPQCARGLGNCFIELPNCDAMVALFGVKWSHEYRSQTAAGVDRFYLQRVTPGACACGRTDVCIGCGVALSGGNVCKTCTDATREADDA
jgi:hypothetical protein